MRSLSPFDLLLCIVTIASSIEIMNRHIFLITASALLLFIAVNVYAQSDRQMAVSINVTRKVTTTVDIKNKEDCGHHYQKDNASMTLSFAASSDKITFRDFGNSIQMPNRPMNKPMDSDKAFSGSGSISSQATGNDGYECDGCPNCCKITGNSSSSSNVTINLDGSASFSYDRKTKKGSFNLSCSFDDPQGQANGIKTTQCPDTTMTENSSSTAAPAAVMKLMSGLYGNFIALNYSQYGEMKIAQKVKDLMQKSLNMSGNGGIGTITETPTGYQISYDNNVTIDMLDTTGGWSGTSTIMITTNVQVSIGGKPIEYDAYLVPFSGDYDTWVPEGKQLPPVDGKDSGNTIGLRVMLVDMKDTTKEITDVDYKVTYELTNVSNVPGVCTNWPINAGAGPDGPDLRFNAKPKFSALESFAIDKIESNDSLGRNLPAFITSYDYGAYGTLTASIHLKLSGGDVQAHLHGESPSTPIPKDKNNNHIADYWEDTSGVLSKSYAQTWDALHFDGNSNDGDGITLFEKYRGFLIHGKYQRLDPKSKHVFVRNQSSNANLQSLFNLFQNATQASGGLISVHVCDPDELDASNVINMTATEGKGGDQYAIEVQDYNFVKKDPTAVNVLAQTFSKDSPPSASGDNYAKNPKDVSFIGVKVISSSDDISTYQYVVAHELGHALGLHHHGDDQGVPYNSDIEREITSKANASNTVIVNAAGTHIDSTVITHASNKATFNVAPYQHSTASGDMNCIMCYTSFYAIGRNETTAKSYFTYVPLGSVPIPSSFCKSAGGKGINAASHSPVSAFGDAVNGNCWGAITIKTW